MKSSVISLVLEKRTEDAPDVQDVLTRNGCLIKVRLGVHDVKGCSDNGLILLVVEGDDQEVQTFISDLKQFPRVRVNHMDL